MPKWKKGETKFTVRISYDNRRGIQAYIPKPIMELLGNPDKITFTIRGKKNIVVTRD